MDNNKESMKKLGRIEENFTARALWLFLNFLLIIAAYYQIKPVSRSLAIEVVGTDKIPYLWIASALVLALMMPGYQWLVKRLGRQQLNLISIALFMGLLLISYPLLHEPSYIATVGFYLLVDIFSVVLVEQFWSLTNSASTTTQGKKWYGFIAAGGLAGGIFGGFFASWLVKSWQFSSAQLLLVAVLMLLLLALVNLFFAPRGIYKVALQQNQSPGESSATEAVNETKVRAKYFLYITALLCLAQLVEPIVEYQFLKVVEQAFPLRDERTAYISVFLGWLGVFSVIINLLVTPLIHRTLGVIAGLTVQPVCVLLSAGVFYVNASLLTGSILKLLDRGLSYSINRASKELLYVPIPTTQIYQLKAWIDMLGYRLFKLSGAFLILFFTQWSNYRLALGEFSMILFVATFCWLAILIFGVAKEYRIALNAAKQFNQQD